VIDNGKTRPMTFSVSRLTRSEYLRQCEIVLIDSTAVYGAGSGLEWTPMVVETWLGPCKWLCSWESLPSNDDDEFSICVLS